MNRNTFLVSFEKIGGIKNEKVVFLERNLHERIERMENTAVTRTTRRAKDKKEYETIIGWLEKEMKEYWRIEES